MSINQRLIAAQIVLLLAILVGFGAALDRQLQSSAMATFDSNLTATARKLAATLETTVGNSPGTGNKGKGPPWKAIKLPPGQMKKRLTTTINPERMTSFIDSMRDTVAFGLYSKEGRVLKSHSLPERFRSQPADTASIIDDYRVITTTGLGKVRVVVAESLSSVYAIQKKRRQTLLLSGCVALGIGTLIATLLANQIVKPIQRMAQSAATICAGESDNRLDAKSAPRELATLQTALNKAFDRLEASYLRERQFASNASHELRTPVAVIRSQTELALVRDRTKEDYREALQTCDRAAIRMSNLIERLMVVARNEPLAEQPQQIDLRQIVSETVALLEPWAGRRGIRLNATLAESSVTGDPEQLCQLVTNLIANAVHHHDGNGNVSVTLTESDNSVQFTVNDDGPGIEPEHHARVFEPFFQVNTSRTRTDNGPAGGLGLTICKQVVIAHNGQIDLESQPGQGTKIRVEIPTA